jgi:hypothetical protein
LPVPVTSNPQMLMLNGGVRSDYPSGMVYVRPDRHQYHSGCDIPTNVILS